MQRALCLWFMIPPSFTCFPFYHTQTRVIMAQIYMDATDGVVQAYGWLDTCFPFCHSPTHVASTVRVLCSDLEKFRDAIHGVTTLCTKDGFQRTPFRNRAH